MWDNTGLRIIFFVLLCPGPGRGSQEFETRPRDTAVNPGDTTVLECRVRHRRGECAWLKSGNVVGRIPNKYSFQREPPDGDCSMTISHASLEDDDAMWRCQVTQASLTDPTLTSDPIRLTVREAPQGPRIEANTNPLQPGEALTARSGEPRRLHCVSRRGNPPAVLRWLLEDTELPANQTNATDVDHPKTFQAVSVLDFVFLKEHNQRVLKCVAMHEAYSTKTSEAAVRLEVLYPPEIALEGRPEQEVEEGSNLSLRCMADANPQANIIWRKSGHSGIYDIKDRIDFQPVRRSDSGIYSCAAKNDVGQSEEVHVEVDVKFRPKIIRIEPKDVTTVTVNHPTKLVCVAEGNPEPKYLWLQQVGVEPLSWQERGRNASLDLHNVSYTLQGAYRCEATNRINGKDHRAQSDKIQLDVTGGPQILTEPGSRTNPRVVAEQDDDAVLRITFCADPRPKRMFWEWGSVKLEAGSDLIRHVAEPIIPEDIEDCYQARLIIQKVEGADSRKYTFHIENERGNISFPVALEVREPVALAIVLAVVAGCVLGVFLIAIVCAYLIRAQKCCFRRSSNYSPDGDSELERSALPKEVMNGGSKPVQAIHPPSDGYYGGRGAVPWCPADPRRYSSTSESEQDPQLYHHGRRGMYGEPDLRHDGYTKNRNGRPCPPRYGGELRSSVHRLP